MLRYLPLILKNCWRNRRRTILTIVSIGVSMCLLGVMIAVYHALYLSDPTPEQALRLVTRNRVSLTQVLPESYGARLRQLPGVQERNDLELVRRHVQGCARSQEFFRAPDRGARQAVRQPTRNSPFRKTSGGPSSTSAPRAWWGATWPTSSISIWATAIHLIGDIYPGDYEFTIRGIFDSPRPSEIMYISRDYLEESLSERRRGAAGTFITVVDSPEAAPRVAKTIDDMFRNSPVETKTETEQAYLLGFVSLLGNVKMILIGISAAVMFTILLVSANTMAMSVRERVREVGILKTLGFAPGTILGLILGEACAISLAGGVIGFILSVFITSGVRHSPAGSFLPAVTPFEPSVALTCMADRGGDRPGQFAGAGAGSVAHLHRAGAAEHGVTAMAIPIAYNLRNLVVRKTTTLMTALGIALTVAVLLAILALVDGLRTTLAASGDPLHVLVMRKGAESEIVSLFTRTQFQDLKFKPGIARGRDGQPLASLEVITVINLSASEGQEGVNVAVRGMTPAGIEMRKGLHMHERAVVRAGQARGGGWQVGGGPLSGGSAWARRSASGAATGTSWGSWTPGAARRTAKSGAT